MLTETQLETLNHSGLSWSESDINLIAQISHSRDCSKVSDLQLLALLELVNILYRAGEPAISDNIYDAVFIAELTHRNPEHPWLHVVEPEPLFIGKTVNLPVKMLSTEKAYNLESIEKWMARIEKASIELDISFDKLRFRLTPKLDGYAAYDDGKHLYTRGDGRKGTDITRVFNRGLVVAGDGIRGQGAGEIVVQRSYFTEILAEHFENARNFQASIIKEKELDEHAVAAIKQQAAMFYPFAQLPDRHVSAAELVQDFTSLIEQVLKWVDYDVDGVVIEVIDPDLRTYMGATRHHHRWQIAYKKNLETVEVKVLQVTPQTSRSGRVNPVAELQPVKLSGALISRATAHHYGLVKQEGIGPGTLIELTRSGLVIPKIERVITPATAQIPDQCPSCGSELYWENDYLYCSNAIACPAQIENTIEHFFKTLANIDGFGRKTIEKLHAAGISSVLEIYQLDLHHLMEFGFGEKTSKNLLQQLQRSKTEAIEDWRFLGAFGLYRMGLGNCERLLQHHSLSNIFSLSMAELCKVDGFAEKTSAEMVTNFKRIQPIFKQIFALKFNLIATPLLSEHHEFNSPIAGKVIVFSGSMAHGSRAEMKQQAKQLGAKVANSVTGKTDFLVTGGKVGAAKISSAEKKGVTVIDELSYFAMLKNSLGVD
jgi:DNA ligase (NAD+)